MRRLRRKRVSLAGTVVAATLLSMTVLFGAPAPFAKIVSPSPRAKVQGVIYVQAQVQAGQGISYVILVVDNSRPDSTNAAPYSFSLDTRDLAEGPHTMQVEAYDDSGLLAASKPVTFYVKNHPGSTLVKKDVQTRLAAKPTPKVTALAAQPKPAAPTKSVASAPVAPARSIAAQAPVAATRTVASAASASTMSEESTPVLSRGPAPEPTRTVAAATLTPRGAEAAVEVGARTRLAGAPTAAPLPTVKLAQAARALTLSLNGRPLDLATTSLQDGRLQSGFRGLFGGYGSAVTWHSDTRTARSVASALTVEVPSGSRMARVNGKVVDMGSAAAVQNGRLVIPVRFFAQATGATLHWNAQTLTAQLEVAPRSVAAQTQ